MIVGTQNAGDACTAGGSSETSGLPFGAGMHDGSKIHGAVPVTDQGVVKPESHPQPGPVRPTVGLLPWNPSRPALARSRCAPQLGTAPVSKVMSLTANFAASLRTFCTEVLTVPLALVGSYCE